MYKFPKSCGICSVPSKGTLYIPNKGTSSNKFNKIFQIKQTHYGKFIYIIPTSNSISSASFSSLFNIGTQDNLVN